MPASFPFLTAYDPPGTSEGTLDPLGLYQIADQLAVRLVPAVRERMQRVRFLTAVAVGSLVTEGLEDDPRNRDASPYLVWEWLLVEALTRALPDDPSIWGVPGTLVAKRAQNQVGYLDARSYLKTPRILGIHGVYKRLAVHLGLVTVDLEAGPNAERLADAWARGLGYSSYRDPNAPVRRWRTAVEQSLAERPPRTKPGWSNEGWTELATGFAPKGAKTKERRCLEEMLHVSDERGLGALPAIWALQEDFSEGAFREDDLHRKLEERHPEYESLLVAIRSYECFARGLQDGFDVLRAEAAKSAQGYAVAEIASDEDFARSVAGLHERFSDALQALGAVGVARSPLQGIFSQRFQVFGEPLRAADCAVALCDHHEQIQRGKSADGKRPWFDRLGGDRIYVRRRYCEERREILPDRYVHDYRGRPIGRFRADLAS